MKNLLGFTATVVALLILAGHSQAQTINWNPAVNMVDDTDVVFNGTYYDAVTFNASPLTIEGVTFNSLPTSGHSHTDGIITITNGDNTGAFGGTFSGGSVDYGLLTRIGTFGEFQNDVTITGLTVGNLYQVQAWSYYTGDGSATTTYSGTTSAVLTNAVGQYAIGTFMATSDTETFNYTTGGGHNFMNAVSVRDLTEATTAPEPSQTMLLGLGLAGLVVYLRHKRQASL